MVQDVSEIRVAHAGMEASGRGFLRALWGGDFGSVNLLSRKVGACLVPPEFLLKAQLGLSASGRTVNLGLERNFHFSFEI